jgi:hypothetical protein
VHDSGQYRRGHCGAAGDDVGQQLEPAPDIAVRPWTAKVVVVGQIRCGQRVQPGDRLKRCPLPDPDQRGRATFQRLGHP